MQDIKYVNATKKSPERVPFALLAVGGLVPECICVYVGIVCFPVSSVVFFYSSHASRTRRFVMHLWKKGEEKQSTSRSYMSMVSRWTCSSAAGGV
jgi:hypothetical protein